MCTNANLKSSNAKGTANILGNDTIQVSEFTRMSIFTKLQHEVFGMGMECSKYKTKWIFRKTIFGNYYKRSETTYIKLSRSECFEMMNKKKYAPRKIMARFSSLNVMGMFVQQKKGCLSL